MRSPKLYGGFLNVPRAPACLTWEMKRFLPLVLPSCHCSSRHHPGRLRRPMRRSRLGDKAGDKAIVHVLNRIGFGPRPGDVERVRAIGLAALHRSAAASRAYRRRRDGGAAGRSADHRPELARDRASSTSCRSSKPGASANRTPQRRPGWSAAKTRSASSRRPTASIVELAEQKLLRAIYSERQLQEVLTDFWFNHFNVDARKGRDPLPADRVRARGDPAARPRQVPRSARGDGEEPGDALLSRQLDERRSERSATQDQQMRPRRRGRDGARRSRGACRCRRRPRRRRTARATPRGLNENYGRELMELHTLGVDGGYTQKDVTEVARAFTGWTIDNPRHGRRLHASSRASTTTARRSCSATSIKAGGGEARRRAGARHPRHASVDGALHLDQAGAPLRQRHAAAGARRSRGRDGSARPTATCAR